MELVNKINNNKGLQMSYKYRPDTVNINDNEYRLYDDESNTTRLYSRSPSKNHDDTEFVIGNAKHSYYTFLIPEKINYKQAYELLLKLHNIKGVLKEDVSDIIMDIELATTRHYKK